MLGFAYVNVIRSVPVFIINLIETTFFLSIK